MMDTRHSRLIRAAALCVAAGGLAIAGLATPAWAQTTAPAKQGDKKEARFVRMIFRSGAIVEGEIVSESPTKIRIKVSQAGIKSEVEYDKAEALKITYDVKGVPAETKPEETKAETPVAATVPPDNFGDRKNLYWIDLEGKFGEEITQTPIRDAIRDAKKNNADVIVMYLNADFTNDDPTKQLDNDFASFDQIFRGENIVEIFTDDIPKEWDKKPRLVMWVRQAMAGAALMPLAVPEIYLHSEGRIGGIGNLGTMMEGVGDIRVVEKQRSLRLAHAEGWAIAGGYDPRLVRAMARIEYVLSVRYVNGKPELFEGYPTNPGEELLTDDGKESNVDTLRERVSGTGNDVLTLNARTSQMLGVSKGTIDTKEDLLVAMGIDRNYRDVPGRSKQIMKGWADGLDDAKHQLKKLWQDEFPNVTVDEPNNYQNRTKARGKQTQILNEMKRILKRWGEGLSQRWLAQYEIPSEIDIDAMLEQIRIQQLKDKR